MDLADFPWGRFGRPQRARQTPSRREPYIFTDVINGPNGPLERFWAVHPHPAYGFPSESTQRLVLVLLDLWLAKRLRFCEVYTRRVDDLCHVIPIEAGRADHRRQRLRAACRRLHQAGFALFQSWRFTKRRHPWLVEFIRAPPPTSAVHPAAMRALEARILDAGGDQKSRGYWRMCIRALGSQLIYRALSEAKLFCRETPGAHFPRVLTSRCEAIAHEVGVVINPRRPKTAEHGRGLASGGSVAQRGRPRWGSVNERGGAQGFILRSRKGPQNAPFLGRGSVAAAHASPWGQ